jgi:serine protease Do
MAWTDLRATAEAPTMLYALSLALGLIGQTSRDAPNSPVDVVAALETAVADAIAKAEPSVVAIARTKADRGTGTTAIKGRNPEPPPALDEENNAGFRIGEDPEEIVFDYGAGVVIGDEGQILTAFNVVRGARRIDVKAPGQKKFQAEVIAADPRSDLAVIVPREGPGIPRPKLTPLAMGDAGKLRKGSFLVALGNPYNAARSDGRASASLGILANRQRRIDPSRDEIDNRNVHLRHYPTLLQLDSKLNLGMSGGAVVNMKGELVGLTTDAANVSGFDAQAGYAIPIDAIGRRVIETLRRGKEVEYGMLGIRQASDLSNRLEAVEPGTPAGDAGLILGDEIVSVGDLPVTDWDSLVAAINAFGPSQTVRIVARRGGTKVEKTVVLGKFNVVGEMIATNRGSLWRGLRVDYPNVAPNFQQVQEVLQAIARGGVIVIEVIPGSPADVAGLRPGQVVLAVGDQPVKSPVEFERAVASRNGPIELTTEGLQKITVDPPANRP